MKNLITAAKQYILLATICPSEQERKTTLFDARFKICPAYIKIAYSENGIQIKFQNELSNLDFKDIEQIKISMCGRRATIRQLYFLTLQIILKNKECLEIETYDYDDGIKLFEFAKEQGVHVIEENHIIELIRKYNRDMEGFYNFISSNARDFFKEHPYDERRLDYLKENKTKYQDFI